MAESRAGFKRPVFALEVEDPSTGERTELADDILRLISQVRLNQVWDGASELTLEMRAWDEYKAAYKVVGERVLDPGTDVIFRAGYGRKLTTLGRFTVSKVEASFPQDGVPHVTITAFDGFKRFVDNLWPGDYGEAAGTKDLKRGKDDDEKTRRWSDIAAILAEKYGMGLAADRSPFIPRKVRKGRRKKLVAQEVVLSSTVKVKRMQQLLDATGKPVYEEDVEIGAKHAVKNAGDSDAQMLKHMAGYAGFLAPYVRYVDSSNQADLIEWGYTGPPTAGEETPFDILRNVPERGDVLFFHSANLKRQEHRAGRFAFRWRGRDGKPATLASFEPTWDTASLPTAVRVHGLVWRGSVEGTEFQVGIKANFPGTGSTNVSGEKTSGGRTQFQGRKTRWQFLTVEAHITTFEDLQRRNALLRAAAVEKDEAKRADLKKAADRIGDNITTSQDIGETKYGKTHSNAESWEAASRETPRSGVGIRFRNAGSAVVELLGNEARPVMEYNPKSKRKEQVMRREVLKNFLTVADKDELHSIAKHWLQARLDLYITATATVRDIEGLETLYPNQVHDFQDMPPEYNGPYMIREATHIWAPSGHQVLMKLQRVATLPTETRSDELRPSSECSA